MQKPSNRFSAARRWTPILVPSLAMLLAAACGSSADTTSSQNAGGNNGAGASGSGSTTSTSSTSTGTGGQSSGTGGQGTGGAKPACSADADCASPTPVCDTNTGECVGCLPANDTCDQGQWCNPQTNACEAGCTDASDCGADATCDPNTHQCVACTTNADCAAGTICISSTCVPGCAPDHDCQPGLTCCGSFCADLTNDANHCGACDTACSNQANGTGVCNGSQCGLQCSGAYADCNGVLADGCEWNTIQDGPCTCTPGATQACYDGPPGTKNVGLCKGGTQTCDATGTSWGPCVGQVIPTLEVCANSKDEDCNGVNDDVTDKDGDGWTTCNGDCCDNPNGCGGVAASLVNPGAYEVPGNGVDDDCNPATTDGAQPTCSSTQKFSSVTAMNVANAIELCQTTTANPPLAQKKWGVISANLQLANGANADANGDVINWQTAILQNYGNIGPKKGSTMAGISSGRMRDQNDPGFVNPNSGSSFASSIALAGAGGPLGFYLSKHAGKLPGGSCGNTTCTNSATSANDSVNVHLSIRVPTNAQSFSYDFRFFSAEYYTYQCSSFNDFYLALLTSGAAGLPQDRNVSFDALNNPVSVNNGFFQVCGTYNGKGCSAGCQNQSSQLTGTGMSSSGGATYWLTTDAPVVPGETIQLDFMVFDAQDHILDSLTIFDNFRWNPQSLAVGTHQ